MSAAQLGSNRDWGLNFGGQIEAQGFGIEVREAIGETLVKELTSHFPNGQTAPDSAELTRVHFSDPGDYEWRLRFFNPLSPDPPDNWSNWQSIVTLTEESIAAPTKPGHPAENERVFSPAIDSIFTANADSGDVSVDFSWTGSVGADGYFLYVSTLEGQVLVNRRFTAEPQLSDIAVPPGSYHWTVRPVNTELDVDGIADDWLRPLPFFTVLPADDSPGLPSITRATRSGDNVVLHIDWTGRRADNVRILVLDPGFMLQPTDDLDINPNTFTTDQLTSGLIILKAQGVSPDGEGPWSRFMTVLVP
jgi:hypothetical protein